MTPEQPVPLDHAPIEDIVRFYEFLGMTQPQLHPQPTDRGQWTFPITEVIYHCPICNQYWRIPPGGSQMSCCVLHAPGTCCHYGETLYITERAMNETLPYINEIGNTVTFQIQDGPIKEVGVNGCQIDDVIVWVKEKIEGFNAKFPCPENDGAVGALQVAIAMLKWRKMNREKRGVEGLNIV